MDKNARYSLIAIGMLAFVAIIFGVASYATKVPVDASANNISSQIVDHSVPLKLGENLLINGPRSITKNSPIIAVNNNLLSIDEAQKSGIIATVSVEGKKLGSNINEIGPNLQFSLIVLNDAKVVQFLAQSI